jgi:HEAT repeat protein
LQEWRDEDRDAGIRDIDRPIREAIAQRLAKGLRAVLERGDQTLQLAAIGMISEMGISVRGVGTRAGFARDFGPDLARLVTGNNPVVSAAAARALGKINPDPGPAAKALGSRFSVNILDERRAAAEGLVNMIKGVAQLAKGRSTTGVEASSVEVVQVGTAVVPAAGLGIDDPDAEVRRTCLEAITAAGVALADLIVDPRSRQDFPPEGRKLSEDERKDVDAYRAQITEERTERLPLAQALADQAPAVGAAVRDPNWVVRIMAAHALEEMGNAQQRLLRRATSVPRYGEEKLPDALMQDPFRKGLSQTVPALASRLTDPNPRVRLAAVDALELMSAELTPAVPALVQAMSDRVPFVRWAAARAIGKVAPIDAGATVPVLARLLCDQDLDVRILGASVTLERFGPAAAAAVPTLIQGVNCGDPDNRIAVMKTLMAIGDAAIPAVPALAQALTHDDVRVRRQAADTLIRFGTAAKPAEPALRKALNDSDPDVRRAAADALLNLSN